MVVQGLLGQNSLVCRLRFEHGIRVSNLEWRRAGMSTDGMQTVRTFLCMLNAFMTFHTVSIPLYCLSLVMGYAWTFFRWTGRLEAIMGLVW